jgi:hypothetical protein
VAVACDRRNSGKGRSLSDENTPEIQPSPPFWGWPPTPKMQILIIAGVSILINVVLIGVWLLVLYVR